MEVEQKYVNEAYKCTMCKKQFKFHARYKKHLETNHNLSCDQCNLHFKTFHQKKRHDRSNHPTNFSTHMKEKKCRVCPDLSFKTEEEYLLHVRDIHKGKFIDCYMCNVCGKTFKTRSELNQHINSKCGTEKQFICKVCGQKLMSPGSLYNHMRRHNDKASFMCRYCAKLFLTAGQLKVHERIHTQQKDFVCNVCNKGFCHRQSLITHSSVHTGIKPYQCEGCGKSFSCVGNLFKHRKTHSDTCGLLPLTTHRVQNPATKIKVRINTPASSKLKLLRKNKEIQEKFAMLDSITDRGSLEESGSSKNEEINHGTRSNIKISDRKRNHSIDKERNIDKRNEFDNCGTKIYPNKELLHNNEEIDIKEENIKPSIKREVIIDNSAEGNDDFEDDSDDSTYKSKSKKAATKIKVRIKTPASSKLKLLKKNKGIQEKFAMLDSATDRGTLAESESSKNEEINQGVRSNIKINNRKRNYSIDEESSINKRNEFDNCEIKIYSNKEFLENEEEIDNKGEIRQEITDNSVEGNDDFKDDSDDSTYKPKSKKACQRNKDPLFDLEVNNFIKERKLENAKRAACKYCNKEYNQFRWLYKHEQDHQKNDILEKGELKSLPFKCSCCKKSFETKDDVKQHQQLTHSDVLSLTSPFWKNILTKHIGENERKVLFGKYAITDKSLLPPKLNLIKIKYLPEDIRKQDTLLLKYQTQVTYGLSTLDKIFQKCVNDSKSHLDVKEELIDSAKILADLRNALLLHRRNNIVPYLNTENEKKTFYK